MNRYFALLIAAISIPLWALAMWAITSPALERCERVAPAAFCQVELTH